VTEKKIVIKSGRYGPYVTDGEINASLPQGADPANLSVGDAVGLLEARAAKIAAGGGGKRRRAAPKAKAKTEKKAAPKKEGVKKAAAVKKRAAKKSE